VIEQQRWECVVPERKLRLAVKVGFKVDSVDDVRPDLRRLSRTFRESRPKLAQEIGFGILTDRAVAKWGKNGVCVFFRTPS
jgi:hypothetical protein